ncbi:MAG: selenide, water dikinase SelD [Gemmatimonadota bacterium]
MAMMGDSSVVKDLVLVGGGHSHVAVLKRFGMDRMPGVRLTLVTRDVHTPYSGMLPGYIAGHYAYDRAHIDLRPLARFAGARLYHDEVTSIDLEGRRLHCRNRPPVGFDVLSLNVGAIPRTEGVPGAREHALGIKPVDGFLRGWEAVVEEVVRRVEEGAMSDRLYRIAVVGAGAGGVELILSIRHRLRMLLEKRGAEMDLVQFHLFSATQEILPDHNRRVRKKFTRILGERGVSVHTGEPVSRVEHGSVHTASGRSLEVDRTLWVTDAAAPAWIGETDLDVTDAGFVQIDEGLRSTSHPFVFAAGDVATVPAHPRPKTGVVAVRQGKPLSDNLRRALEGREPRPFRPQKRFLSLISTGERYAVASRSFWALEGRWVWRLKDWIDRRWMDRWHDLPEMEEDAAPRVDERVAGPRAMEEISAFAMRCGGCGSKVGATVLERVLGRLDPWMRDDVLIGLDAPDDCAVARVPDGMVTVQTVDFFRALVDDPYLFGRIASNHALGDIWAMGAEPQTALALATVPFSIEEKMEELLFQLMSGATDVLRETETALAGGHTTEGPELAFGLQVSGIGRPEDLLRKGGMRAGDALVLTKPVGTGTLFAADMRGEAKGRWISDALHWMGRTSGDAARILRDHGATACTDVTGFGLLGHLVEMTRASKVDAVLALDAVPLLDGAAECIQAGIFSSLQPQNIRLRRAIRNREEASRDARYPLIFDPQTAGGLLASVPAGRVGACMEALHAAGWSRAAVVGRVEPMGDGLESILVVDRLDE